MVTTADACVLRPGEAVPLAQLSGQAVQGVQIGLAGADELPDLVAMVVSPAGKVRTDDDLVFYNNDTSGDRAVRWLGRAGGAEWIQVVPATLDADVNRVVFGCAGGLLDEPLAQELVLMVADMAGAVLASARITAEASYRAMILFEVYRRRDEWRCRLLAQGYAGGLAVLVTEFGVDVDDPGDRSGPPVPAGRAPLAASASVSAPPVIVSVNDSVPAGRHAAVGPGSTIRVDPPGAVRATPPQLPPGPPSWVPPAEAVRRGGLFTSRKRAQLDAQAVELQRLAATSGALEAHNAELSRILVTSGALDNAAVAAERGRLTQEVGALAAEAEKRRGDLAGLERRLHDVRAAIAAAESELELHDVGIYRYRHRLDDSIAYKGTITALRDTIRDIARRSDAVTGTTDWTVNGSIAQGRKMVKEFSKLMLRAYNADADHAVRTMRAYKLDSALTRLDATRDTIARLGATMNIRISDEYHYQRRYELELTADYLSKVEEEKERQRQLREDQREQQRADAEYAREQERLERDRHRYSDALARLEERGETQKAIEIRAQLTSVNAALAGLAQRRANLRLGHVYVISNIGAFGKRMVKIGMTRRLDPMDRVRELGDASVPFRFDVHALIFSEDAVSLETALHHQFAEQRVNHVNARREFFYVTPAVVRDAIAGLDSHYLLEFREDVDAPEWRQSGGPDRALLPT